MAKDIQDVLVEKRFIPPFHHWHKRTNAEPIGTNRSSVTLDPLHNVQDPDVLKKNIRQ